jgi:hypothetical protein
VIEVEIRPAGSHLPGVVEHSGIEVPVRHDAPLRLQQQAVAIAKPAAGETAQRTPAADVRQHEEGNLLIVVGVGGLGTASERDHPGLPQNRKVLDDLVVDLAEAELRIVVGVVLQLDVVEASASRIASGRTPVEADQPLRVYVVDLGPETRKSLRRIDLLD